MTEHEGPMKTSDKPESGIRCDQCDYTSPDVKTFVNHILNLHKQIVTRCDRCGYEAESKEALLLHMIGKHADIELMNMISSQIAENKDMFQSYSEQLTGEINKIIGGHNNMMQEIAVLMRMVNDGVKEPITNEVFCCEECNYKSNDRGILKTHKKEHHRNNEVYCCEDCDFKSTDRGQLKRHKKEHYEEETPKLSKPSYADVARNDLIDSNKTNKLQERPRKKQVLVVGDSHMKNLDKDAFEDFTGTKIDIVTAYTVDADPDAKYKDRNLIAIVPQELKRKNFDYLVLQSGCNEISNLDCLKV